MATFVPRASPAPLAHVRALHDFSSTEPGTLKFRKGDQIAVFIKLSSGWWDGSLGEKRGWFPSNYVTELSDFQADPDLEILTTASSGERRRSSSAGVNPADDGIDARSELTLPPYSPTSPGSSSSNVLSPMVASNSYSASLRPNVNGTTWVQRNTPDGRAFYYNLRTRQSTWEPPVEDPEMKEEWTPPGQNSAESIDRCMQATSMAPSWSEGAGLKRNLNRMNTNGRAMTRSVSQNSTSSMEKVTPLWGRRINSNGRAYFFNMLTDETVWNMRDIDMETNYSASMTKTQSSNQGSFSGTPSMTQSQPDDPLFSAQELVKLSSQRKEGEEVQVTWLQLTSRVVRSINRLNHSVKSQWKASFIRDAAEVVDAVRLLLLATDLLDPAVPALKGNSTLLEQHTLMLKALVRMVLSAKLASRVWPPPDAMLQVQADANEVMLAMRHLVNEAQAGGIALRVLMATDLFRHTEDDSAVVMDLLGHFENIYRAVLTSSERFVQFLRRRSVTGYSLFLEATASHNGNDSAPYTQMISLAKTLIQHTSNLLTIFDDIQSTGFVNIDSHPDAENLRFSLYNAVGLLVVTLQMATDPLADLEVFDEAVSCAQSLDQVVKELVVIVKVLVEVRDEQEFALLEEETEKFSFSIEPSRRSFTSLTATTALSPSWQQQPTPRSESSSSKRNSLDQQPIKEDEDEVINTKPIPTNSEADEDDQVPNHVPIPRKLIEKVAPWEDPQFVPPKLKRSSTNNASKDRGRYASADYYSSAKSTHPLLPSSSSIPDEIKYLKHDYKEQELAFTAEGTVKGGTLTALVERLTPHDTLDPSFVVTFLLTYRSFTTTEELFEMLFKRFLMEQPIGLDFDSLQLWREKKLNIVRLRVFNIMKIWLENYYIEKEDRPFLPQLRDFASITMAEHMESAGNAIIKLIDKRQDRSVDTLRRMVPTILQEAPAPIWPKNPKKFKVLDIDTLELSRQLTLMDSQMFQKIKPVECLNKAWSDKDSDRAANIKAIIELTNRLSHWVMQTILSEDTSKKRAYIVKYFISIAEKCYNLYNFNTLMAILSGLNSAPIHRLKDTWEEVPQRFTAQLEVLKRVMNPTKNFSAYRELLHSINPPLVPFLGVYLTDLTFIDDGNPDQLKDSPNLINFSKRAKTADVVRDIQQYQALPYHLTVVPDIQAYVKKELETVLKVEDLFEQSMKLEPRVASDEKVVRLLEDSGVL